MSAGDVIQAGVDGAIAAGRTAGGPVGSGAKARAGVKVEQVGDDGSEVGVARLPRLLVLSPSADMYGSDRALLLALPEVVRRFEVTLVSAVDGPALAQARALGVRTIVSPDWALRRRGLHPAALPATLWRVGATLRLLRGLHRRDPFELVYANTVANALLPVIRLAVARPLVVHVREVPRDRGRMAKVLFTVVERVADRVLCNSGFTATLVGQLVPGLRSRLRTIPNGLLPLDAVAPAADDDVLDVVCVGRIHPKKGHATLIEAARLARLDGRRWHLHFWGDALPEHAELAGALRDAVAAADLTEAVTWHGFCADTRTLYQGMDVAVVPSVLPEEFSMVTAEAQLVGLPVVATGPGGPSDIIEEGVTGTIVPPEDPAALARALRPLEDAATRHDWGRAGRERVLTHFSVERYAPAVTAELLATLYDSPGPTRRLRPLRGRAAAPGR